MCIRDREENKGKVFTCNSYKYNHYLKAHMQIISPTVSEIRSKLFNKEIPEETLILLKNREKNDLKEVKRALKRKLLI